MHDSAARLDGGGVVPQLSQGGSRRRHAREHTHSATATRTRINGDLRHSIVHSPNWHFVNVVGIYTALAWRNKAFRYGTHAKRAGKLKIKAYWNLREKKDNALSDMSA